MQQEEGQATYAVSLMCEHFISCGFEGGGGFWYRLKKSRTKSVRQTTEMSMRDGEERGSEGEKMGVH